MDALGGGLRGGSSGLTDVSAAVDDMRVGMDGVQRSVTTVSGYLDPRRDFVAQTPDCAANPLCSTVASMKDALGQARSATSAPLSLTAAIGPRLHQLTDYLNEVVAQIHGSAAAGFYLVKEATKGGTLAPTGIDLAGVGPVTADLQRLVARDTSLLVVATLVHIFMIVTGMLRSPVAGLAVVGTVVASFASALGVSALIWHHLLHHNLH